MKSKGTQSSKTKTKNVHSQAKVKTHSKVTQVSSLTSDSILQDDPTLKLYTGLENCKLFEILHDYLTCANDCNDEGVIDTHSQSSCRKNVFKSLSTSKQLLLILYKLRRNPLDSILGLDFGVSVGTVSESLIFWIKLMYRKFKIINNWPSKEQVKEHMQETKQKQKQKQQTKKKKKTVS